MFPSLQYLECIFAMGIKGRYARVAPSPRAVISAMGSRGLANSAWVERYVRMPLRYGILTISVLSILDWKEFYKNL